MNCPECGQGFSVTVGPMVHGERVRRKRHCVVCKEEWLTVEITVAEHARLEKVRAAQEQVARLWEER